MKVDESAVASRRAKKPTVGGANTPAERTRQRGREMSWSRAMFYSHLWFGVLFTVVLLVIGVTGIVLNHKRELGIMPDPEHQPMGAFAESLPLHELANRALAATGLPLDVNSIDRMDVRPRNGFVKIRFRDAASSEATVDLATGTVIHIGPRGDVFMEKLHSGEIFGSNGVLLSDAGAAGLIILLISGYWLWLKPRFRR